MLEEYRRPLPQRHREYEQAFRRKIGTGPGCVDGSANDIALAVWCAQTTLAAELLGEIHAREPVFFEELVIDVLLAMGYGTRRRDLARRLGRSSDGGVDGLISVDELGLDLIYLQGETAEAGQCRTYFGGPRFCRQS